MIKLNNLRLIILSLVCSHFVFGGVIVDNENQLPREAKVCGFFSRPKSQILEISRLDVDHGSQQVLTKILSLEQV